MSLLIFYGVLAIGVSFLCSMLEASLLSLPRSQIEVMVEEGSRVGRILRDMKTSIDRPLAAILTLNTVAHTVGAAGVGAQAAHVFGDAAVGVASGIMTLLILVLSEIIPKTLGAVHARKLAGATAFVTQGMIVICFPIIIALEQINKLIGYQRHKNQMSRSELFATVRLGHEMGSLDTKEFRIVANLLALEKVRLNEILTPRTVVFSLPESMTVGEVVEKHQPLRYGRIPIYGESTEQLTGYVPRFVIHSSHAAGESHKVLKEMARKIAAIPELATAADALDLMLQEGHQILEVVDEWGGLAGVVTLEDLLETLLGQEIVDESDLVADMRQLARRRVEEEEEAERAREQGPSKQDPPQ